MSIISNKFTYTVNNTITIDIQRISNKLFSFSSYHGGADWRFHFDYFEESESQYLAQEHNYTEEQIESYLETVQDNFINDSQDKMELITVQAVQAALDDTFDNFKFDITGISYPTYYNCSDDQLEGNIILTVDQWQDDFIAKANGKDFDNWLKENYSSCGAFISWIPNNLEDFNLENVDGSLNDIIVEYVLTTFYSSELENFSNTFYEEMTEPVFNYFAELAPKIKKTKVIN